MAAPARAAQRSERPRFEIVRATVESHFASSDDYRAGDLITQSQVQAALQAVRDAGWQVPEADRVVQLTLTDSSFMASQLATRDGRKFMRKVAQLPGGYERLDRLSSMPHGRKIVRDLIGQPGGDKFIEYLATAPGGRQLGNMLAHARQGTDLNKPTGRIYTADDLLAVLQRIYANSK